MADYIFVNPSPNMARIAKMVSSMGYSVNAYRSADAVASGGAMLHYFTGSGITTLTTESAEQAEGVELAYRFKRSFFGGNPTKKVRSLLSSRNAAFAGGTITDYAALNRKRLSEAVPLSDGGREKSFAALCREFPEASVITAAIPGSGGEMVTVFETDYEARTAMGTGYFIFMIGDDRIEAYAMDDRLITITPKNAEPIAALVRLVPSLARFTFKKASELPIERNFDARIRNSVHEKNGILLNDYSFFDVSIRMPDDWYERAGRFLCSGKRQ